MQLKFEWRPKPGPYTAGAENCYVGGKCIGHVHWPSRSRDYVGPRWRPDVFLPDTHVNPAIMKDTMDEAKGVVERVATKWFETCLGVSPPAAR